MSAMRLNVIKPSVNNMTARVFMRAAGLDFSEQDIFGQTRSADYLARCPSHLTPMIESESLPKGVLWESCAIMQYLCNKHGIEEFYPKDPEQRAMIDSAMFYLIGTFYPYVVRATYPALGFRGTQVKSATAMPTPRPKRRRAGPPSRPSQNRSRPSTNSTWTASPSSAGPNRRSPTSGLPQRLNSMR